MNWAHQEQLDEDRGADAETRGAWTNLVNPGSLGPTCGEHDYSGWEFPMDQYGLFGGRGRAS